MNTYYQLNASTIFLQATVLIVKVTHDQTIIDLIAPVVTIIVALVLLQIYILKKKTIKKYAITLLLIDMIFINIFQKRNPVVSYAKYMNIGRLLYKYTNKSKLQTFIHLPMVGLSIGLESLFYDENLIELLSLIGWYFIFFFIPPIIFKKKEIKPEIEKQLPLSADISQFRESHPLFEHLSQKGSKLEEQKNQDIAANDQLPPDFYYQILQKHHEGILILTDQQEPIFISESLKKILGVRGKQNMVQAVLSLKNSNSEIKEQERMKIMFQTLAQKLNSGVDFQESYDGEIEKQQGFSESYSVQKELERILEQTGQKVSQSVEKCEKKIKFQNESHMICQQDSLSKTLDRQQTFQSTYKGPNLFEVIHRSFLIQRKVYVLITIKDVTHFNQIRVLQTINENKSQMIAQVAHEFRTPLNCISLFVENLAEHIQQPLIDEYLKPIQISAQTLLSFVNDLLDVAQLKAGKFKLVHVKLDLNQFLTEIQQFLKPQIESKGNQLLCSIQPNIPMWIYSDPNRIRQILFNLVSNSNKFTKNGQIGISLVKLNQDQYEISVHDTGVGIEPQDQEKLFQAFSKLDRNKEMNSQGVGLGLMISNILAERLSIPSSVDGSSSNTDAHGLTVYSEGKGKGTQFKFQVLDQFEQISLQGKESKYTIKVPELEIEDVQKTIKRAKTKLDRQFGQADILIMIVDDEPFNIAALTKSLQKKFVVEGFYNGQDAINRVQQPLPQHTIILQDLEMPMMDGYEISKQIKALVGEQVTIIGCSGHGDTVKQQCFDSGMEGFLQKPVKLDQLMKIIDNLF